MKYAQYLMLVAAVAVLMPLHALAKQTDKGKMQLTDPAYIGATQLQPGTYEVEWSGNGPAVQVNITRDKKIVATTSGKLVQHDRGTIQDAVVVQSMSDSNHKEAIVEIDFRSLKESLVLAPNQTATR